MTRSGTKEKILEAALSLFSSRGYSGTPTKEIARTAGVAELTVFRHFSSKERLFEEVINRYTFLPELKGMIPEVKDMEYEEALYEMGKKYLERLSERKELIRIMLAESYHYPAKVRKIYYNFIGNMFRTLAAHFRELQKRGIVRDFNPEAGARAFLGMFFAYFHAEEIVFRKKLKKGTVDTIISEFVRIFAEGTIA